MRDMTSTELTPQATIETAPVPAVGPPAYCPGSGWVVTRSSDARAVLADPAFGVAEAPAAGSVGSIEWLRASVSRFTNGPDHACRRARVVAELEHLDLDGLRADAQGLADALIVEASEQGHLDLMQTLARRVPVSVLAARLGIADADRAADAVRVTAAAYFPGAADARERAASLSTAELVEMLSPSDEDTIVAKIAVMVHACDAIAALIGKSVCHALPPAGSHRASWSTEAIIAEVVRHDPPLRITERVSRDGAILDGHLLPAGMAVLLRVDSANRDPADNDAPHEFDPGRRQAADITFGYGIRPCPGRGHALELAAGAVQAVRDRCSAVIAPVPYEPHAVLRMPARVEVSLS
jgi:cytochrome P450